MFFVRFCFCNDMIIASARFKSVQWLCNLNLQEVCLCGCGCVHNWYERKKKKNLPQVLFYVLKSCEKSTKCPYGIVFKSWFVMCSLAMFYFKIYSTFLCYGQPHDSHVSTVVTWSDATVGNFLMYLASWSTVHNGVSVVCWRKTVFLNL